MATMHDSRTSTATRPAPEPDVREIRNFIDGRFVGGVGFFEKHSPVDGRIIARVAQAGPAEVDAAVEAARKALRGPWSRLTVAQRCELLYRIADGIGKRFDGFLAAEVADTGKPAALARQL